MDAKYTAIIAAVIAGTATVSAAVITSVFKSSPPSVAASQPATARVISPAASATPAPDSMPGSAAPIRPQPQPDGAVTPLQLYAQATASIAVRTAPDRDASVAFQIPGGRTFSVTGDTGGSWLKVEFEGQSGFIRKGENYVVTG